MYFTEYIALHATAQLFNTNQTKQTYIRFSYIYEITSEHQHRAASHHHINVSETPYELARIP